MQPIDPAVAAAVRARLGLAPGTDPPGGLVAAAHAVTAAGDATVPDGGSIVLIAVGLIRAARADPGGVNADAFRATLGEVTWPLLTMNDVAQLVVSLLAFCAEWATDEDLDAAEQAGRDAT